MKMDNFKNIISDIKRYVDCRNLMRRYGINVDNHNMCRCFCHDEKTPSMSVKFNYVHCFGCGVHLDCIDITCKLRGKNAVEACQELDYMYGLGLFDNNIKSKVPLNQPIVKEETPVDYTDFLLTAHTQIHLTDYAYKRGLSDEVINRFKIGYCPNWKHPKAPKRVPTSPRLIIPTSKYSYLARDTRDNLTDIQKKYCKIKVGKIRIFNTRELCTKDKHIFVVEGEIDALSIITVGGAAIALGSCSNIHKLIKILEVNSINAMLIICMDNDKAGISAIDKLSTSLNQLRVPYCRTRLPSEYKDCNDFLLADINSFQCWIKDSNYWY